MFSRHLTNLNLKTGRQSKNLETLQLFKVFLKSAYFKVYCGNSALKNITYSTIALNETQTVKNHIKKETFIAVWCRCTELLPCWVLPPPVLRLPQVGPAGGDIHPRS